MPAAPSRLVPRDGERRDIVRRLLQDDVRLLTLVGLPGAGKTRLSLMTAADVAASFADGVAFVDLSAVHDPVLVPAAVGAALGMRETTDRSTAERLAKVLRSRHLLLILDTFEHVLPAASAIADLLAVCGGVKVLATSREALHLAIEHRLTVGPLALPSPADEADQRRLEKVPSVALFCLRAQAVRSDWILDEANGHAVAELCRRVDGLPLGIELAAAWVGMLSPRAILTCLDTCLNVEAAHAPDLPDRHRTLRAAIGWSYDLLSEDEQAVFDRFAVFSDGWDQQAAAAVAGVTSESVLPMLAGLAEKHLIWSADQADDGEPRFGLLDTLHAFARTRFDLRNDVRETRRRHAEHYLALADRAERALIGPDQRTWLDRLERELGNLRAGLRWALDEGESGLALRLASALWFFWDMRGHLREGQQWLDAALSMEAPAEWASMRAAALNAAGWLALVQHASYGPAIALLEQAQSAAEAVGDNAAAVRAQAFLGLALALGSSERERSEDLLERAVRGGREIGTHGRSRCRCTARVIWNSCRGG